MLGCFRPSSRHIFVCLCLFHLALCWRRLANQMFLSCLPRSFQSPTVPVLELKTRTLAKGAQSTSFPVFQFTIRLPRSCSYQQVGIPFESSSLHLHSSYGAPAQQRDREEYGRYKKRAHPSGIHAPCDMAPCISSRSGAGCRPLMVQSGRMDEGSACRSGRCSSSCQRAGMALKLNSSPPLGAGHCGGRSWIVKLQDASPAGGVVCFVLLCLIVTWRWSCNSWV